MEDKESSFLAVSILRGLKEAFTYKELEELLGVPAQVLWRYASHVQFPEKGTAKKILDVVKERRLLERAIAEIVTGPQGVVEEWRMLYNPRFLNLVGYVAWRSFKDDDVDVVLAPSEEEGALASVVADWLGAEACTASERARANWGRPLSSSYLSSRRGELVYVHVPKGTLEKGSKVLVVKGVADGFESLPALASIIEQAKALLVGALVVLSLSDERTLAAKVGKVKVVVRRVGNSYEVLV